MMYNSMKFHIKFQAFSLKKMELQVTSLNTGMFNKKLLLRCLIDIPE